MTWVTPTNAMQIFQIIRRTLVTLLPVIHFNHRQAWTNCGPEVSQEFDVTGAQFLDACILHFKKEKYLDLLIFSRIGKPIKQLQWISNTIVNTSVFVMFMAEFFNSDIHCWRIVPCTRNTTHDPMFTCLMTSKLLYILMSWEKFN